MKVSVKWASVIAIDNTDSKFTYIPAERQAILRFASRLKPTVVQDLPYINKEYMKNIDKVYVVHIMDDIYIYGYKPGILSRVVYEIQEAFNQIFARLLINWAFGS